MAGQNCSSADCEQSDVAAVARRVPAVEEGESRDYAKQADKRCCRQAEPIAKRESRPGLHWRWLSARSNTPSARGSAGDERRYGVFIPLLRYLAPSCHRANLESGSARRCPSGVHSTNSNLAGELRPEPAAFGHFFCRSPGPSAPVGFPANSRRDIERDYTLNRGISFSAFSRSMARMTLAERLRRGISSTVDSTGSYG